MATKETHARGPRRFFPFRSRTRNDAVHLMASPKNAERLTRALAGARARTGTVMTMEELRAQYELQKK